MTHVLLSVVACGLVATLTATSIAQPAQPVAGIINGDTILLNTYTTQVAQRARELSATSTTASDIVEQTWQTMVQQLLIRQAAQKRGITASSYADVVDALQQKVTQSVQPDTSRLYKEYLDRYTTANVDVIHLPCVRTTPTVPPDSILRAYYQQKQRQYVSLKPLRRLACLTWALRASPVDTSLMVNNIAAFVRLLNEATTTRSRDSIWTSVAETVPSGTGILHRDSAVQSPFYEAVHAASKSKKTGIAVGPLQHPSGVHVFLVDSARAGRYVVRVIIPDIEPSRETVDSIMQEVRTAQQMFQKGRPLVDLAGTFGSTVELSPYVSAEAKLFESYRLVKEAFATPVGSALDPIDTPERGAVLAVVVDSLAAGQMDFDDVRDRVLADWQRDQACSEMRTDMLRIHAVTTVLDDGRMMIGAPLSGASGAVIERDVLVDASGAIGSMNDPLAAQAVRAATTSGLLGPFRGDNGWYLVNVHYVVRATPEDYRQMRDNVLSTITNEQKKLAWEQFLRDLLDSASIEDRRGRYFRF
ncbi:MAG: SurA N-terminal domain-containing protein [Candidatus Kapaibacteriota bacterium]